jgi:hypothetical protein
MSTVLVETTHGSRPRAALAMTARIVSNRVETKTQVKKS